MSTTIEALVRETNGANGPTMLIAATAVAVLAAGKKAATRFPTALVVQELIATGTANLASGAFGGFPIAGGFSRTAVNHQSMWPMPGGPIAPAVHAAMGAEGTPLSTPGPAERHPDELR